MNPRNDRENLAGWGIMRGRPAHHTDYTRRPRANGLRLGDWLPVLLVVLALAICLFLYTVPEMAGWIEAGL